MSTYGSLALPCREFVDVLDSLIALNLLVRIAAICAMCCQDGGRMGTFYRGTILQSKRRSSIGPLILTRKTVKTNK